MTRARSIRLTWFLSPLLLACGDSEPKSDSLSASGGASNITSASETSPDTPTGTGASEASSTPGSTSNDAGSAGSSGSGELSTGATGTSGDSSGGTTSGGTMTTSDASGTTAPIDEPTPCQIETTKITPIPPDLLFVLDKSGSMAMEKWDHDNSPQTPTVTRWYSLHGVVKSVVNTFNKTVNFGVKLFPKIDATGFINMGACDVNAGVEVEIAPMNAAGVLAGIPAVDFEVAGARRSRPA